MFRREVKSLEDIVAQCLRHDGLETPLRQKRLLDSWGKVAGKAIEKYTGEKFIRNQVLFVKILNPALRADLSMLRERLVKNLNAEVGAIIINDIKLF